MDERRNPSYCMDLTAYEAIKNIERKEEMMDIMKAGEIWETDNAKPCLILAVHEKVCTILTLHDESKSAEDLDFCTTRRGWQYTHPSMLSYKFKNLFESYVETLNEETFKYVQSMVKRTLGLNDATDIIKTVEEPVKQAADQTEYIRLEAERDFWKQQAEGYLERLLG